MQVKKLMTKEVKTCSTAENTDQGARLMWENDFGCVPVVDENNRIIGMLTDRDICMAAYTQGNPLGEIPIASAMSTPVYSCRPEDTVQSAEEIMRKHQVRRLPVVDAEDRLVGIVSLNDLILEAGRERMTSSRRKELTEEEITQTLEAISAHRLPQEIVG